MNRLLASLAVTAAVVLSATCTMADTADTADAADAAETAVGNARYRVTFQATWSAATHPTNFPGNPHFSGPGRGNA